MTSCMFHSRNQQEEDTSRGSTLSHDSEEVGHNFRKIKCKSLAQYIVYRLSGLIWVAGAYAVVYGKRAQAH